MGFVKFFGLFFKCLNGFLCVLKDLLFGLVEFLDGLFLLLKNFDGITKFDSLWLQFCKLIVRLFQLRQWLLVFLFNLSDWTGKFSNLFV